MDDLLDGGHTTLHGRRVPFSRQLFHSRIVSEHDGGSFSHGATPRQALPELFVWMGGWVVELVG